MSISYIQPVSKAWEKILQVFHGMFSRRPVRLAIVRRYADANGSYVGELYLQRPAMDGVGYEMAGVSLDTLPLDSTGSDVAWTLDTKNDFLAPISPLTVRVGSFEPQDNDRVRRMVAAMPRRRMTLVVQNRFIEYVMEPGT